MGGSRGRRGRPARRSANRPNRTRPACQSYGLAQATRFINIFDGGYADKLEKRPDERFLMRGFDVRLQIPIFDFGEVRVRQAEATYMQAVNRLLESEERRVGKECRSRR